MLYWGPRTWYEVIAVPSGFIKNPEPRPISILVLGLSTMIRNTEGKSFSQISAVLRLCWCVANPDFGKVGRFDDFMFFKIFRKAILEIYWLKSI
ncbi:unnamed protein product [Blepharisma stoltei]|uniref:Uncharacterized protein n=1 Tax=Blepharisma stoltei TaxID=1481888 RepID=A0AAU9JBH1_9CILI|nr:unnamed protein product [Blepharisma stoltei]